MTKIVAGEKDPHTVTVKDIMAKPVVPIPVDKDLIDATKLMCSHKVRRFPVVDSDGKLLGVLSLDDILIFVGQEMQDIATGLKCEPGK
jgi:CBS domain-containing protein